MKKIKILINSKNRSKLNEIKIRGEGAPQMKILSFEKKQINDVLNSLNVSLDEKERITYKGEVKRCEGCDGELTKDNFGSMLSNSKHFFCDNPVCIAKFVRETQFEKKS